jgi:hypothetical protein
MIQGRYRIFGGMRIGRGNKYSQISCHSAAVTTTIPTRPDLELNPISSNDKPATNPLGRGTVNCAWDGRNM